MENIIGQKPGELQAAAQAVGDNFIRGEPSPCPYPIMLFIMERILSMSMPFDFIMFMQKGVISAGMQ